MTTALSTEMPPQITSNHILIPHKPHTLAARLHHSAESPLFAAIIAHGLFSSMASEKLTLLTSSLAGAGGMALQFDHGGCGDTAGDITQTSLSSRKAEYLAAAQYLREQAPGLPLVYLGSSMGGSVALLAGQELPPACTVIWSAPLDYRPLAGRIEDGPDLTVLGDDLVNHDLQAAAAATPNLLVVHGEKDEVVPVSQAQEAHALAPEPKDILILEGADHRLSRIKDQKRAIDHTISFVLDSLNP